MKKTTLCVGCLMYFLSLLISCQLEQNALVLFDGDFVPPKLEKLLTSDANTIEIFFDKEVSLVCAEIVPVSESFESGSTFSAVAEWRSLLDWKQEDLCITITLPERLEIGVKYVLSGIVKDHKQNSLMFESYFTGFNDRIPTLILSEVRTEYAKPKVEFVELYAVTAGNIGGVRLISTADGFDRAYTFPPIEVSADSFIVLHYRSIEDGLLNEYVNPQQSQGTEALLTAYDLWIEGSFAALAKTDVLLLESHKDGALLDALLYAESKHPIWPKRELELAALRAFEEGIWNSFLIDDALMSDYTTVTRTISRQYDIPFDETESLRVASRDEWVIVDSSQATPGKKNSSKVYVKK